MEAEGWLAVTDRTSLVSSRRPTDLCLFHAAPHTSDLPRARRSCPPVPGRDLASGVRAPKREANGSKQGQPAGGGGAVLARCHASFPCLKSRAGRCAESHQQQPQHASTPGGLQATAPRHPVCPSACRHLAVAPPLPTYLPASQPACLSACPCRAGWLRSGACPPALGRPLLYTHAHTRVLSTHALF